MLVVLVVLVVSAGVEPVLDFVGGSHALLYGLSVAIGKVVVVDGLVECFDGLVFVFSVDGDGDGDGGIVDMSYVFFDDFTVFHEDYVFGVGSVSFVIFADLHVFVVFLSCLVFVFAVVGGSDVSDDNFVVGHCRAFPLFWVVVVVVIGSVRVPSVFICVMMSWEGVPILFCRRSSTTADEKSGFALMGVQVVSGSVLLAGIALSLSFDFSFILLVAFLDGFGTTAGTSDIVVGGVWALVHSEDTEQCEEVVHFSFLGLMGCCVALCLFR